MPTYKYNGRMSYMNSLKGIYAEPGDIIETRYILDNNPDFERISDEPYPYADYTIDYTLQPGQSVIIDKSMFEGLHQLVGFKIADESDDGTNKAYLYIDSVSDDTKNVIDSQSTVNIKGLMYRNIDKLILIADENNQGNITIRLSFGYDVIT